MAYAIIQAGGKQFRVSEGEVVRVPSISEEPGATVEFDVLASGDGDNINIGAPIIDGTRVTATVVEHGRGPKIIVFKKKRRKQYKKKHGHRQNFTAVRIDAIGAATERSEAAEAEIEAAEAALAAEVEAPVAEAASAKPATETAATEPDATEPDATGASAEAEEASAEPAESAAAEASTDETASSFETESASEKEQ